VNEAIEREGLTTIYQHWCKLLAGALEYNKSLLAVQWELCLEMVGASRRPNTPARAAVAREPANSVKQLQERAIDRIKRGLAPPREIYEVPYRSRIDWSAFPDWARPCDPEAFEECTHEG
jgi:hypothetical protein